MKILAWPIEVIAWFDDKGSPTPLRLKLKNIDETSMVLRIDRIIQWDREKVAGNIMYVFKCQSVVENVVKVYELKYELSTCKWVLYKM